MDKDNYFVSTSASRMFNNFYFGPKRDTLGVCWMGSFDVDWEVLAELHITTCTLKCAAHWHIFYFNNCAFLFLLYSETGDIAVLLVLYLWWTDIHLMLYLCVLTVRLFSVLNNHHCPSGIFIYVLVYSSL